jgi:hypothetical protein
MKRKHNRWIMGSAVGIAAALTAIDHTRHKVPQPDESDIIVIEEDEDISPCGPGASPCGPGVSPCGPDESPCGV